jgi:uncharacterized membrane protein HdeD (DUF308 family)
MINVLGVVFGVLAIAGGIFSAAVAVRRGGPVEFGSWSSIAAGVLLVLACVRGIRSRARPDSRLMFLAMLAFCAAAFYTLLRVR